MFGPDGNIGPGGFGEKKFEILSRKKYFST
jgi:hypothetical protein